MPFDILLYHPRVKYRKNRPDWLYHLPDHTFVKVKSKMVPDTQFPVLVKAFRAEEPPEAAPVDIIEFTTASDITYLVLKKGKYRIEMVDRAGEQYRYELEFD